MALILSSSSASSYCRNNRNILVDSNKALRLTPQQLAVPVPQQLCLQALLCTHLAEELQVV